MKKRSDKGQMKITFGLIFSIILIIVFIGFAFFGIKRFIVIQDQMKAYNLINDLEYDVNEMWRSSSGSVQKNYSAPKDVQGLCFEEQPEGSEDHNVFFVYENEFGATLKRDTGEYMEHLNWLEIRQQPGYSSNYGLCFEPDKYNNIAIALSKDYTEVDVTIGRPVYGNGEE